MTRLGAETMTILWSAPTQRYSLDIDYEYRQDSNLYYLTALAQEGSVLVLMPGNVSRREILFVKDRDPAQEHWHGRILSVDEVRDRTGIQTVLTDRRVRAVRRRDAERPRIRRDHDPGGGAILRRAVGGSRPSRPRARRRPQPRRPAEPAASVRPADPRAVCRLRHHRRDADSRRARGRSRRRTSAGSWSRASRSPARHRWPACAPPAPAPTSTR